MFDNFPSNPIALDGVIWQKKYNLFSSSKVNDLNTKKFIEQIYQSDHYILDPHTAVAMDEALRKSDKDNHYIVLSTAHPAKFPRVYEELGIELLSLPISLIGLYEKEEHLHAFDADYKQIRDFISQHN